MKKLVALSVVVIAGALTSDALATVRVTKSPGRVAAGDKASVTVSVTPRARCTIGVYYSSSKSEAKGLGPKRGTTITWTWTVGSNTNAGRWPVKIDCGKSGKVATSITVR